MKELFFETAMNLETGQPSLRIKTKEFDIYIDNRAKTSTDYEYIGRVTKLDNDLEIVYETKAYSDVFDVISELNKNKLN